MMTRTDISLHDLQDQLREEARRSRARSYWTGIGVLAATLCVALLLRHY